VKPWTGGRILSLDPSSTACGWAVFDSYPVALVDFKVIKAGSRKDELSRIRHLCRGVLDLIAETEPDKVILEWASGKVNGRIKGRTQGLATMGHGQGWIAGVVENCTSHEPQYVYPNDWKGNKRKDRMAQTIAAIYPEYAAWKQKDRGFDAADAIGMAHWWLQQKQIDSVLIPWRKPAA
jgi:Holliday junction resolvasome RuvABC endonuclease subunit